MILQDGERLEDLQYKGLKIIQDKNLYCFTSDSVILANFISTKKFDNVLEIGAGSGVISILLQAKNELSHIYAFEIQEKMANLCKKNLKLNNIEEKITLFCEDAQNFEKYLPKESLDVVFSNPPYFKQTNFNQNETKKIAKEEVCLSCEKLCEISNKMLKNGGSFYCCYGAERCCELISNCVKNNLIIKQMFFTENGKGEVKLVVVKAVKNARHGCKVFPNLVTNEENGDYMDKLHTKYIFEQNGTI